MTPQQSHCPLTQKTTSAIQSKKSIKSHSQVASISHIFSAWLKCNRLPSRRSHVRPIDHRYIFYSCFFNINSFIASFDILAEKRILLTSWIILVQVLVAYINVVIVLLSTGFEDERRNKIREDEKNKHKKMQSKVITRR